MSFLHDISPDEFDEIERFLHGEMSVEESAAFERRLQEDRVLKQKVDEVKLLSYAIDETVLRQTINDFHVNAQPTFTKTRNGKVIGMRRALLAVASILLLGLVTWSLFSRTSQNDRLYSQYYKPDPGLMTAMGVSDNYIFEKAMVDYKNGDYENAFTGWSSLLVQQPSNDTLNYFIGETFLAQKQYKKAIPYFQKVSADDKSAFYSDAGWHLGLIYLKLGELDKAKPLIQRSGRPESHKILEALNSK